MTRARPRSKAWIIDDTSFSQARPAFGRCGIISIAGSSAKAGQLPSDGDACRSPTIMPACRSPYRLYLPAGVDRRLRPRSRKRRHVPAAIRFQDQAADCAGADPRGSEGRAVAPGVVLMDASYGNNSKLAPGTLTGLGLSYVAAIIPTVQSTPGWREDDPKAAPRVSVEALALSLPKRAWRTVTWREGNQREAAIALCPCGACALAPIRGEGHGFAEEDAAHRMAQGARPSPPNTGSQPSTPNMSLRRLVDLAKLRWRIEHDYRDSQAGNRPWTL